MANNKFQFAVDRGGTFTDIYARCPNGKVRVMKLLSVDPENYDDAPREGIRKIIESETGLKIGSKDEIDPAMIEWIRMGTTVATNALLERKGEPIALVITKGFRDVLYIGNQARPKIFDLEIKCPETLYSHVIEVNERVVLKQDTCQINNPGSTVSNGITGESLEIWSKVNRDKLKSDLNAVFQAGIRSLAVVLLHSYTFPNHEKEVAAIAKSIGFTHVTLSSDIMPMVRIVPRGFTACSDAYLTPHIHRYVTGFAAGFKGKLANLNVLFMQSDGGLTPVENFSGSRAILSGPAGGVVGYAVTASTEIGSKAPIIGFDMGGTSTDVSRYDGVFEHTFETTTAGVTIQAPQLDIHTVAAGGGSMLFFRNGLFVVGPESAGAYPGPVCYRNGGSLTVTDANLCLGRIIPSHFPKIFGPSKNLCLDKNRTINEFDSLTMEINEFLKSKNQNTISREDVALGFIRVANETMCRPIRAITQAKGYDTSRHVLACFGGAGGQHSCSIAKSLGIKTVFIHKYAGILSAFGMACADVVKEVQTPAAILYSKENFNFIDSTIDSLKNTCWRNLADQGFNHDDIKYEIYLNLRFENTDFGIMCMPSKNTETSYCEKGDFNASFFKKYQTEFGFVIQNRPIVVDDIRVRGIGKSGIKLDDAIPFSKMEPKPDSFVECYFEHHGYVKTPVYLLSSLFAGHDFQGPAFIIDGNSTILVEHDCEALITSQGNIKITVGEGNVSTINTEVDPIQLSIFSHRFMSIAEQMGRILQRTSISTNIKERLDFSCALFGPDGGLVSNAPHIPVHLGSMQEAVMFQLRNIGHSLKFGDVILSNHPCAGGSHLPDLTVITPVFYRGCTKPVFFVASRGHHADIGGITPGSMPPHSTNINQEGATFVSFKIVDGGVFQEEALINALMAPAAFEGSSGTRALKDNLSDLKAQIAANQKGIKLVSALIDIYSLEVVQAYMGHIQKNAELAVRDMLKQIVRKTSTQQLVAEDFMDDGTIISLKVNINENEGTAIFDFNGTGLQVYSNCNAPKAVTLSAIIYCLRCMVGQDVPLNQGCLKPIKVIIPEGSILWPSDEAAVVGGNVLTSQRIVDVILKAFQVCAASQGCMNNITFGDETHGYYETVAGGSGAGPSWAGRSGVHTHMTNTRITDPEIIEKRYPIIVKKFELNPGTGGDGKFKGGDGVIRELLFRKSLILSVLTERRVFSPYGMKGGMPGRKGLNILTFSNGRSVNLGAKCSVLVRANDVFHLETPGGGGFGAP